MPPKVASIFGGSNRVQKPDLKTLTKQKEEIAEIEPVTDRQYDKILSAQVKIEDPMKPKYIFAALEKADERKAFAEEMKTLNLEREIRKLEEKNGPFIRYYTDGNQNVENEDEENGNEEETNQQQKLDEEEKIDDDNSFDFEGMKQRYMERLDSKDILKLKIRSKKLDYIINYAEISKKET